MIRTESMQAYTQYMQGRDIGDDVRFHTSENGNLVMEMNGFTVVFIDRETVRFNFKIDDGKYVVKTATRQSEFHGNIIEFSIHGKEYFEKLYGDIQNSPITFKQYQAFGAVKEGA